METMARSTPVKSSSQSTTNINWPIVTFWLTYFGTVFGILYALISEGF